MTDIPPIVTADEDAFRYGTVLFNDARKEDIERHLDTWGPGVTPGVRLDFRIFH